jgi:uncharacterized RDD family membrane protein YckC/ribosomal protein L37E
MAQPITIECPRCHHHTEKHRHNCAKCGYNLSYTKEASKKAHDLDTKMEEINDQIERERTENQFQKFLESPVLTPSPYLKYPFEFASIFRRIIAYSIDSVLIAAISVLILSLFLNSVPLPWRIDYDVLTEVEWEAIQAQWEFSILFFILIKFLLGTGYFFLLESRNPARTLGQWIVGLEVINLQSRQAPSRLIAFVLAISKNFEMGLLLDLFLARNSMFLPLIFTNNSPIDRNMIRFSQRITNTIVIKKRR